MLKSPNIPSNYGFGIWFNKKEKREYYVTPSDKLSSKIL